MKRSILFAVVAIATIAVAQKPNPDKIKLEKAEKAYATAKLTWTKDKTNKAKRKTYIGATVTLGTVVMESPLLTPKAKYPRALNLYREALRLDPTNKEAKANKKMIEDIYRSMGRPVPQ